MIKIQKPPEPQVLVDNKVTWTQNLLDAIATYGEYSNIPEAEKSRLLSHYRHKDIQDALFESSHHKCAFCECIHSAPAIVSDFHRKFTPSQAAQSFAVSGFPPFRPAERSGI